MKIISDTSQLEGLISCTFEKKFICIPFSCNSNYHYSGDKISCVYFVSGGTEKEVFLLGINNQNLINFSEKYLEKLNWKNILSYDSKILIPYGSIYDYNLTHWYFNNSEVKTDFPLLEFYSSKFKNLRDVFSLVPSLKISEFSKHLEEKLEFELLDRLEEPGLNHYHDTFHNLCEIERNGILYEGEAKSSKIRKIHDDGRIYGDYRIHSISGRPSNTLGGFNFLAISRTSGIRKNMISGEGKILVEIDFKSFHPYLISYLVGYDFKNNNPYEYLSRYYGCDIEKSKSITMRQIYGSISEEHSNIPFFKATKEFIHSTWDHFQEKGYIETPLAKRKIRKEFFSNITKELLFNYVIQSYETEYMGDFLKNFKSLIIKDKQIYPILYLYDSLLFEVDNSQYEEFLKSIEDFKKQFGIFMSTKSGKSYQELS